MRPLNLLPRKKFLERFFWLILLLILFITCSLSALILYTAAELQTSANQRQYDLAALQQEIEQLNSRLQKDTYTARFDQLSEAVSELNQMRNDWPSALQLLSDALPAHAWIKTMRSSEESTEHSPTITVRLTFNTLEDIHLYTERMMQSPIIEAVVVDEIVREHRPAVAAGLDGEEETVPVTIFWDVFMTISMNL